MRIFLDLPNDPTFHIILTLSAARISIPPNTKRHRHDGRWGIRNRYIN